jgi:hypothetical protein
MPPRARARIDRPAPKNLRERIRREVEEQGAKALLVLALAGVLVFMVARLVLSRQDATAAPRTRPSPVAAAAPAPPPATAPAPAAQSAPPPRPPPSPGGPAGAAPQTVAEADAVVGRLERLARRLEGRPPPPPFAVARDPFDRSALDAEEAAILADIEARLAAAAAARREAAAVAAAFSGRLNATVPELGVAFIDGKACRLGERAGLYEVVEIGAGWADLRSLDGQGAKLRLIVWKEQQDLGRYVRPMSGATPGRTP